jgi:hypothetical protein
VRSASTLRRYSRSSRSTTRAASVSGAMRQA